MIPDDVILKTYLLPSFNIFIKTLSFPKHYILYNFVPIQDGFKFTMPYLYLFPI